MAIDPKSYSTYAFGQQNFTLSPGGFLPIEGTPANAVNIFTVPVTTTQTATQAYQGYIDTSNTYTAMLQAQQEQHRTIQNALRDTWLYGSGTWHVGPLEPPKALETRSLTKADREALEKALPF